jgi:hypothetical protein
LRLRPYRKKEKKDIGNGDMFSILFWCPRTSEWLYRYESMKTSKRGFPLASFQVVPLGNILSSSFSEPKESCCRCINELIFFLLYYNNIVFS